MAAGDFTYTPSGGAAISITVGTEVPRQQGASARFRWFTYSGVNGRDGIKLGEDGRSLELTGWIESTSETNLATALEALGTAAKLGVIGTLSIRGGADSWTTVVIDEAPELLEHLPLQPDGATIAQRVRLHFQEL